MEIYRSWCSAHPEADPKDYFKAFEIQYKIENKGTEAYPVYRWVVWTENRLGCLKTENTSDTIEQAENEVLGQLEDVYKARKSRGVLHRKQEIE